MKEQYGDCVKYIRNEMGNRIKHIIPQVYCESDIDYCIENGYEKCMISMWKCYGDIFSIWAMNFINYVKNKGIKIYGIATWYKNYKNDKIYKFEDESSLKIFYHGQTWDPHLLDDKNMKFHNDIGIYFFKY